MFHIEVVALQRVVLIFLVSPRTFPSNLWSIFVISIVSSSDNVVKV